MGFWADVLEALKIITATPNSTNGDTAYVGGNKINQSFEAVGNKLDQVEVLARAKNAFTFRNVFVGPDDDPTFPDWLRAIQAINYSITTFYGGQITCAVGQQIVFVLIKNTPDPGGSPVPFVSREYFALTSGALEISELNDIEDITPFNSFNDQVPADEGVNGFLIYLGAIAGTIEDGFNSDGNEPFDMVPGIIVSANFEETGMTRLFLWQGPSGNWGDSGTSGPASSGYFFEITQSQPLTIENEYLDITAMLADQGNQTINALQYVAEAGDDPDIEDGGAYYRKLTSSTATLADDYDRLTAAQVAVIQSESPFLPAQTTTAATRTLSMTDLNRLTTAINPIVWTIPNGVSFTTADGGSNIKQHAYLAFKDDWTINYPTTDGDNTLSGGAGALVYVERRNIGNEWIVKRVDSVDAIDWGIYIIPTATASNEVTFDRLRVFGTPASPRTGNITNDLTGALEAVVQKMYHNSGTAPTVPAGWVLIGGAYVEDELNIIYAEWVSGTRVEYWIAQEV